MFEGNLARRDTWDDEAESIAFTPRQHLDRVRGGAGSTSYFLTGSPQASWLGSATRKLNELGGLPVNWDSYGGLPLSPEMHAAARFLVEQIAEPGLPEPSIVPTSNGSVQLEWHGDAIDLELRLVSPTVYEMYFENGRSGAPPTDQVLRYDLTPLRNALAELRAR